MKRTRNNLSRELGLVHKCTIRERSDPERESCILLFTAFKSFEHGFDFAEIFDFIRSCGRAAAPNQIYCCRPQH